jgi:hypothetical protein
MNQKLTVVQAAFLAEKCEKLFERAAQAWVSGNNSGDNAYNKRAVVRCDKFRTEAEALLKPYGIEVDYPGLYPSFKVKGFEEHTVLSALSAALDDGQKARVA